MNDELININVKLIAYGNKRRTFKEYLLIQRRQSGGGGS